ncbi:MAG TPA: hypothetical protein VN643_04360 [Pyrinomonadaceae bacterium]|nr:hypothetical protein [Pyrinomonadaceae bacterium]
MKKLLILTLTLASFGFFGLGSNATEAKAAVGAGDPQIRVRIGPQRNRRWRRYDRNWNRGFRTVTQSRIVRYGHHTYRETYAIRYFNNGQTQTTLISRERIG